MNKWLKFLISLGSAIFTDWIISVIVHLIFEAIEKDLGSDLVFQSYKWFAYIGLFLVSLAGYWFLFNSIFKDSDDDSE